MKATLRWVALTGLVAVAVILGAAPILFDNEPWTYLIGQPSLWYVAAGLVVMAKRRWHVVGWLLIMLGLGLGATSVPTTPDKLDPAWYPWFTWTCGTWGGYFGYTAMAALLVAFPDGLASRSRRGQRLGRLVIGGMALMTVLAALTDPVVATGSDGAASFPNPLGVSGLPRWLSDFGYIPVLVLLGGCVFWLWRRQRHEHGEERRRYTLVLYAFSLLVVAVMFGLAMSESIGEIAWIGALAGWFLVPIAFAYATIRKGLYGVDRLVRRTVSYGLVGAIIAAIYVTPVLLLPRLLGESNDLVIAISTLAAAAVFNPIRRRIQSLVDHRFDRSRFDAEHEVDIFAEHLSSTVALATVVHNLEGVLQRTLAPEASVVWIRRPQ